MEFGNNRPLDSDEINDLFVQYCLSYICECMHCMYPVHIALLIFQQELMQQMIQQMGITSIVHLVTVIYI